MGGVLCNNCAEDEEQLRTIYRRFVAKYPKAQGMGIAEVFRLLVKYYEENRR